MMAHPYIVCGRLFVCTALLLLEAACTQGDVLITKTGTRFVGQATDEGDKYLIVAPNGGKIRLPKNLVAKIVTTDVLRGQFEVMRKGSHLANDEHLAKLIKFIEDSGLAEERARLIQQAYEVRWAQAQGKPNSLVALAQWCEKHGLKQQAALCELQAKIDGTDLTSDTALKALMELAGSKGLQQELGGIRKLALEARLKRADLTDDAQVTALARFAAYNNLHSERVTLLARAYNLRRTAVGNSVERLEALASWCKEYHLDAEAEECTRAAKECTRAAFDVVYAAKAAEAGTDPAKLDELAQWCAIKSRPQEAEQALQLSYAERKKHVTTLEQRWNLVQWCADKQHRRTWGSEQIAAAIEVAVQNKDLSQLQELMNRMTQLGSDPEPACIRAMLKVAIDTKVKDGAVLGKLAVLAQDLLAPSEASEFEASLLKNFGDDALVRAALGYVKSPVDGRYVREPWVLLKAGGGSNRDAAVQYVAPPSRFPTTTYTLVVCLIRLKSLPDKEQRERLSHFRFINRADGKPWWEQGKLDVRMENATDALLTFWFSSAPQLREVDLYGLGHTQRVVPASSPGPR